VGGKLSLQAPNSDLWQCSTYRGRWRVSGRKTVSREGFAEDWYLGLKGKHRSES
jgi:hypothetical protein